MTKIRASTQNHLDILDIRDNFVILKNGNVVAVLGTTAVNFDLLSEREQDAIIGAYGSLLNSLSFPIQIIVRSQRLDIGIYLEKLHEKKEKMPGEKAKKYAADYIKFIKKLTKKNEVLDKKFYVAIPYGEVKISLENPAKKIVANFRGQKPREPKFKPQDRLEHAQPKLEPRVDHLAKQFARIGIRTRQLETKELIKLFYESYNT